MRLAPTRSASSTVSCVTSRQRRTPRTSSSIDPTISPALSYSSCSRKGATVSMRSYNSRMRIAYLQCQYIAFHKSIRHERPNRLSTDQGGRPGANCWFRKACSQLNLVPRSTRSYYPIHQSGFSRESHEIADAVGRTQVTEKQQDNIVSQEIEVHLVTDENNVGRSAVLEQLLCVGALPGSDKCLGISRHTPMVCANDKNVEQQSDQEDRDAKNPVVH